MKPLIGRVSPSLSLARRRIGRPAVLLVALLWLTAAAPAAHAGYLCVDPTGANRCYTRITDAVTAAWSGETITVHAGYYVEHSISIGKDLILNAEPGRVIVDGGGHQIFWVTYGANATLRGFTLVNGRADWGGALFNKGTVTLEACDIRDSHARHQGGALYNDGDMTITNIRLQGNTAGGQGGGIANGSTLTLIGGDFMDNRALGEGGGFYNDTYARATLVQTRMTGHQANVGGAIWNGGALTVERTWISDSVSGDRGGDGAAIYNQGAFAFVNATFTKNRGRGGVLRTSGNSSLRNVTIVRNTSGPALTNLRGVVVLKNTLIADNAAPACEGVALISGSTHNMADDATCGSSFAVRRDDELALGVLGEHGSELQTIPLLSGSAAIDAGDDYVCPLTDQRGMKRPQLAHCDIGAYEYQGATDDVAELAVTASATLDVPTLLAAYTFTVTNYGPLDATHLVVSIVLPRQVALLNATAQGLVRPDDAFLWLMDTLPAGQHASLTLQARIAEALRGQTVSVTTTAFAAEPARDATHSQVSLELLVPPPLSVRAYLPLAAH